MQIYFRKISLNNFSRKGVVQILEGKYSQKYTFILHFNTMYLEKGALVTVSKIVIFLMLPTI